MANTTQSLTTQDTIKTIPYGVAIAFFGKIDSIPQDFALVDGSLYNNDDIDPEVVAILGKRYNRDATTPRRSRPPADTTRLPNLSNRVLRGAGNLINLGDYQEDALQNIKGFVGGHNNGNGGILTERFISNGSNTGGILKTSQVGGYVTFKTGADSGYQYAKIELDASLSARVAEETRVKSFGVNYITRIKNTVVNPIVEEITKVTLLEPVNAGDALHINNINSKGTIFVNKLTSVTRKPYEFAGLAVTQGIKDDVINMQIKGLAPFTLGDVGENIYIRDNGDYTRDASLGTYYIGAKVTNNELYMADRIYIANKLNNVNSVFGRVGDITPQDGDYNISQITGLQEELTNLQNQIKSITSDYNSVKKIQTIFNNKTSALTVKNATDEAIIPLSNSNQTGNLFNYSVSESIIEILNTNSVYNLALKCNIGTNLNNITILFTLLGSNTKTGEYKVQEQPIKTRVHDDGTIEALFTNFKPQVPYYKVLLKSVTNGDITFATQEVLINNERVNINAFVFTLTT